MKARQYGDSYLVLKDVRLRCTMCSTDSGGGCGNAQIGTMRNLFIPIGTRYRSLKAQQKKLDVNECKCEVLGAPI